MGWMYWTAPVAVFFAAIAALLAGMTLWEMRSPFRSARVLRATQLGATLGVSIDVARAAFETAKYVIAQVNPQMPRTQGDALIHVSKIDSVVEVDEPLHEVPMPLLTEADIAIGRHIAELIDDGATLQMGIGAIPDAALQEELFQGLGAPGRRDPVARPQRGIGHDVVVDSVLRHGGERPRGAARSAKSSQRAA